MMFERLATLRALPCLLSVAFLGCSLDTLPEPSERERERDPAPERVPPPEAPSMVGPALGQLVIVGGGGELDGFSELVEIAGGPDEAIVFIPTAREDGDPLVEDSSLIVSFYEDALGLTDLTVMHTRDRDEANNEAFVAPLRRAKGLWFGGGRQWRLADSYLDTLAHEEMWALLDRGGVIGGSSAGATIQGSFLWRGDTKTNTILMGDHQEGLGFLRDSAIDTHVAQRGRELDLIQLLDVQPELLGLGLDEDTFVVVEQNELRVGGDFEVHIHDRERWPEAGPDADKILSLHSGQRFDLGTRTVLE